MTVKSRVFARLFSRFIPLSSSHFFNCYAEKKASYDECANNFDERRTLANWRDKRVSLHCRVRIALTRAQIQVDEIITLDTQSRVYTRLLHRNAQTHTMCARQLTNKQSKSEI